MGKTLEKRYFDPLVRPSNDPGVCTRISSTPTDRAWSPMYGASGIGASRSLTLAPCLLALGELDDLIRSSSDAMDSSSGVHEGEEEADFVGVEKFRVVRLAIGSSRRRDGGTCGLVMGPITADAGGVRSWIELMGGVWDSERTESATDLGSHDEMEGRRVLEGGEMGCVGVRRLFDLSTRRSAAEEWESWSSFDESSSRLRFG